MTFRAKDAVRQILRCFLCFLQVSAVLPAVGKLIRVGNLFWLMHFPFRQRIPGGPGGPAGAPRWAGAPRTHSQAP